MQPDTDCSATTVKRRMHKVHVYAVGGDYADNGVDQLIIDGEAMPVLKALIKEGKTPGVCEGAVRLLTRLCTTLEARQEVRSASSPYNMFPDCLASVLPLCCITVLLPEVVIEPDVIKEIQALLCTSADMYKAMSFIPLPHTMLLVVQTSAASHCSTVYCTIFDCMTTWHAGSGEWAGGSNAAVPHTGLSQPVHSNSGGLHAGHNCSQRQTGHGQSFSTLAAALGIIALYTTYCSMLSQQMDRGNGQIHS